VAAVFDLTFSPIHRIKGKEWPSLPGLLAVAPPRRAARGRREDHLVAYLSLSGNTPVSTGEYSQITAQMAERFYQNPGALTSALRAAAESLNQALVDRNMRGTGHGQFILARLILGVLRGAQFIFIQCGPTHIYHLGSAGAAHIHDPQVSGKGLGFSQTTPLYFSQVDLHPGDLILLCASAPAAWEEALAGERGLPAPDALRLKLLALSDADLEAVLIQARAGSGKMSLVQAAKPAADTPPRLPAPESARPAAQPAPAATPLPQREPAPAPAADASPQPAAPRPHVIQPGRFVRPVGGGQPPAAPGRGPAAAPQAHTGFRREAANLPEIARPAPPRRAGAAALAGLLRGLARGLQAIRRFFQAIAGWMRRMLPRLLPASQEGEREAASRSTLAFIAIAAPLLIVTVAAMVYLRFGRPSQYEANYDMAMQAELGAIGQSDPAIIQHAWESTLYYLDEAEKYQVTQQSQSLRWHAQTELDNLDLIIRLDFQPAIIGGLSQAVRITRMAASESDLYLLNASAGNVLRAQRAGQGYEVDAEFECTPGAYGETTVGTLVDLLTLPNSDLYNAADLLGIDAQGNLLYCARNAAPVAFALPAPALGLKSVAAFTLDAESSTLYLLDPGGSAVWSYFWVKDKFDEPAMFFGNQVPPGMDTALDLAVRGENLFLLFQDGHVAACTGGGPCVDPDLFNDPRPGHFSGATLSDAVFDQMLFAGPSDPSLYMLESMTKAVYRFSARREELTLQSQYQPVAEQRKLLFTAPVSTMAISPNGDIFLSLDSQVYFGSP
jgi:hypothetical protein